MKLKTILKQIIKEEVNRQLNEKNINVNDFINNFNKNYSHIGQTPSDVDVKGFLDNNKGESISSLMNLFSDYLLSNGLTNDIQE